MAPPQAKFNEEKIYNAKILSEEMSKADFGSVEIPAPYLTASKDKPTVAHDQWADVPVLDFSEAEINEAGLARRMVDAVGDCGFFKFTNHGVPMELIEEVEVAGYKFFSLPFEEKQKVVQQQGTFSGYTGDYQKYYLPHLVWSEAFQVSLQTTEPEDFAVKLWPEGAPEFSAAIRNYVAAVKKPQFYIFELLAIGLGLPRDFFAKHFSPEIKVRDTLRCNYYPTCPKPLDVLGNVGHTDTLTAMTILHDGEVGGLQILKNGKWMGIKPVKGALVCNAGDILRLWTNDILKSSMHRVVVNDTKPRMSTVVFLSPSDTDVISAPSSLVEDAGQQRKYKDFTFVDFLKAYAAAHAKGKFANECFIEAFAAEKADAAVDYIDT